MDTLPVRLGLTRASTFLILDTIPQAHLLLMSLMTVAAGAGAQNIFYEGLLVMVLLIMMKKELLPVRCK